MGTKRRGSGVSLDAKKALKSAGVAVKTSMFTLLVSMSPKELDMMQKAIAVIRPFTEENKENKGHNMTDFREVLEANFNVKTIDKLFKDKKVFDDLYASGNTPWQIWRDGNNVSF